MPRRPLRASELQEAGVRGRAAIRAGRSTPLGAALMYYDGTEAIANVMHALGRDRAEQVLEDARERWRAEVGAEDGDA